MARKKVSVQNEETLSSDRWRKEVFRQSLHVGLGLFLSGVLFFTDVNFFRIVAFLMLAIGIIFSIVARSKHFPALNRLLQRVERKNESIYGQSAFMFVLGALIPSFIFPNPFIVFLGIFALTWQDSFSTLFGVRFGRTRIFPNKSLEGSFGGLFACTIGLSLVVSLPLAFLLALFATIIELLPVDDSLSIPLAVAFMANGLV